MNKLKPGKIRRTTPALPDTAPERSGSGGVRPSGVQQLESGKKRRNWPKTAGVPKVLCPGTGAPRKSATANESPVPPAAKYVLRLFVAGATARSRLAILRVRTLCATELKDLCDLEVIDIYQQPALARANQIVATPTLIIKFPPPLRRFIGNLANLADLCIELDLVKKGRIAL